MSGQPSPRQEIAERLSRLLGAPVKRVLHGRGHRKRRYDIEGRRTYVRVEGTRYIVVAGEVCQSEEAAVARIKRLEPHLLREDQHA